MLRSFASEQQRHEAREAEKNCVAGSWLQACLPSKFRLLLAPKPSSLALFSFLLCMQNNFSYFYPEFARVKFHFAKLWLKISKLWVCHRKAARWPQKCVKLKKKLENFLALKIYDFIFSYERSEYAEQKKTDVKEKNLFFFSFRKRKFKLNFFSIKCQLFTNFPLLHDFLSLN